MAVSKKEKLIKFYEECLNKSYLDMTDSDQALKAKVVAMDLGLKYKTIDELFEAAKKEYETYQAEKDAAEKAAIAESERRSVKGELLLTATGGDSDSIQIYRRPDKSCYSILDYGKGYKIDTSDPNSHERVIKVEGLPRVYSARSATFSYEFHPSQTVFTGASSGGIMMGGTHQTKAYTEEKTHSTGNGALMFNMGDFSMEAYYVSLSPEIKERFKRDASVSEFAGSGRITVLDHAGVTREMSFYGNIMDFNKRVELTSYALDSNRSSLTRLKEIISFIERVFREDYPPSDETLYSSAVALFNNAKTSAEFNEAAVSFERISDYKDSAAFCEQAKTRFEEVLQQEKEAEVLRREEDAIKRKKNIKRFLIFGLPAIIVVAGLIWVFTKAIPDSNYRKAVALFDNGEYENAITAFEALHGYRDSVSYINEAKNIITYNQAQAYMDSGDREKAIEVFNSIEDYKDSKYWAYVLDLDIKYDKAMDLFDAEKYKEAEQAFSKLMGLQHPQDLISGANKSKYNHKDSEEYYNYAVARQEYNTVMNGITDLANDFVNNQEQLSKYIQSLGKMGDYKGAVAVSSEFYTFRVTINSNNAERILELNESNTIFHITDKQVEAIKRIMPYLGEWVFYDGDPKTYSYEADYSILKSYNPIKEYPKLSITLTLYGNSVWGSVSPKGQYSSIISWSPVFERFGNGDTAYSVDKNGYLKIEYSGSYNEHRKSVARYKKAEN